LLKRYLSWGMSCTHVTHAIVNVSLGAFSASELDVVFSGYQPC